jgi:hypothetical protein
MAVKKNPTRVQYVSGLGFQPANRAVAFLVLKDEPKADAYPLFEKIEKEGGERWQYLMQSFGLWMRYETNDRRFHGWPNSPDYKGCQTFKWREKAQHNRFYGFVCHPNAQEKSFQLCVLATHGRKNSDETDFTLLDRAIAWWVREDIKAMIHTATQEWLKKKGEVE